MRAYSSGTNLAISIIGKIDYFHCTPIVVVLYGDLPQHPLINSSAIEIVHRICAVRNSKSYSVERLTYRHSSRKAIPTPTRVNSQIRAELM